VRPAEASAYPFFWDGPGCYANSPNHPDREPDKARSFPCRSRGGFECQPDDDRSPRQTWTVEPIAGNASPALSIIRVGAISPRNYLRAGQLTAAVMNGLPINGEAPEVMLGGGLRGFPDSPHTRGASGCHRNAHTLPIVKNRVGRLTPFHRVVCRLFSDSCRRIDKRRARLNRARSIDLKRFGRLLPGSVLAFIANRRESAVSVRFLIGFSLVERQLRPDFRQSAQPVKETTCGAELIGGKRQTETVIGRSRNGGVS
jgi:hypothetical protein